MAQKFTDENWEDVPSILTINEVADLLRVHRNTISTLINDGTLPYIPIGTREKRIKKIDLLRFIGEEADDTEDEEDTID